MSYVTNTHLEKFTEKLLTNDKNIRDELKREISNLPSGGGSTGTDGKSLEFNWQGTSLGIRKEGESTYSYTDLKGNKGDKGDPGLQGPKGDKGDKGDPGLQGPKGDKGDKGADGTMTFADLTEEQKESLRGLQGPKGPKGDTGAQGPKGDNGVAGKSAYQIAVDNGYVGNESTWVASLKGDKGDTGAQGPKGDKGDTGKQGLQGSKGDKGDTGAQGPQGIQGEQGPKGDKGDQGNDGFTPIITFNNEKTEMTVRGKTTTDKVDFKKITENVVAQTINNSLVTVNVLTQEEYDTLGSYGNEFYFIKG